jgi:hypothetical protein
VEVLGARTDDAVLALIERWVGILEAGRMAEAIAFLAPSPPWTPDLLARVIENYGFVDPHPSGKKFRITPPRSASGHGPRFEVVWLNPPAAYIEHGYVRVAYADYRLPLDGEWSDVSAIFDIVALPDGDALMLDDVHVL